MAPLAFVSCIGRPSTYNWQILFCAVCLFTIGCSRAVQPVPLDVAIRGIAQDLRNAGVASIPDVFSPKTGPENPFDHAVRSAQCFFRTPNPTVPVMVKDFSLALQGTFTAGGKFSVNGIPTPTAGVEISISGSQQQTLTIPVAFTSVANLPYIYVGQIMSYIEKLPDTDKKEIVADLLKRRGQLTARVTELIETYPKVVNSFPGDPNDCKSAVINITIY
jgi:hypothetical protein